MPTFTGERRIWIWQFAGLGLDGVDSVSPLGIATTSDAGRPSTSVFEDPYACLVARSGARFKMRLDGDGVFPVSGQSRDTAASVSIVLDDDNYPEVARYFLASAGSRTPVTRVAQGFEWDPTDTTINVETGTGSLFSANDIVYWRRQAFRVASTSANSITVVDSIPDPDNPGSWYAQSSNDEDTQPEGQFGTFRAAASGRIDNLPPFEDDRLYLVNPFLRGREVILWSTDGESVEQVWGRFTIQGDPTLSDSGCEVTVRLRGVLGMMQDRQINYRPNIYQARQQSANVGRNGEIVFRPSFTLDGTGKTNAQVSRDTLWEGAGAGVVQVDKGIACGPGMAIIGESASGWLRNVVAQAVQPWLSEDFDRDNDKALKANELLCSDPLDGTGPTGVVLTDETAHPFYSSALGASGRVANHPFEFALCFLGAIPSNLPEHWRGSLPPSWVDVDGILDAAETTYEFARGWPGELWGKDGKAIKLGKVIEDLLRGAFATTALTDDGKLTFRGLFDLVPDGEVGPSRTLEGRGATIDQSNTVDQFSVRTGISFSKDEIAHVLTADDGYETDLFPYADSAITINAPGLLHPDTQVGDDLSQLPNIEGVLGALTSVAQLFRYPLPIMRVDATGATRIRAGRYLQFQAPGLRADTTGLTDHDAAIQYLGFVTATEQDIGDASKGMSQSLTVIRMPYQPAVVGPAAEVASVAAPGGNTTLTLTQALYVEETPYNLDGEAYTRDVEQFSAGQECIICDEAGAPKTDPFTITSTTFATNLVTVTGSIAAIGGGTYSHASGDVLTLADADDAAAADLEEFAWLNAGDAYGI